MKNATRGAIDALAIIAFVFLLGACSDEKDVEGDYVYEEDRLRAVLSLQGNGNYTFRIYRPTGITRNSGRWEFDTLNEERAISFRRFLWNGLDEVWKRSQKIKELREATGGPTERPSYWVVEIEQRYFFGPYVLCFDVDDRSKCFVRERR